MAAIRENKKNNKTVSFRFTIFLERDAQGKQVRKYTTWTPPEGLTHAKAKRAAEKAAEQWEQETRAEYQKEQEAIANGRVYQLPPDKGLSRTRTTAATVTAARHCGPALAMWKCPYLVIGKANLSPRS